VSDDLRIVDARDEDGDAIAALIEPIFLEYEGVLFLREEFPELDAVATTFHDDGGRFWCAFRGNRLVGTVGYVAVPGGVQLRKLYVASSERGHGLGSRLCDLVEETVRAMGAPFIELWSDVKFVTAHRLYQKRGYVKGAHTRALHDASDTIEYYFKKELITASYR
jgi:GNAT superfamily N-acetyltransferase